jgi:hypothetical protein
MWVAAKASSDSRLKRERKETKSRLIFDLKRQECKEKGREREKDRLFRKNRSDIGRECGRNLHLKQKKEGRRNQEKPLECYNENRNEKKENLFKVAFHCTVFHFLTNN